MKRMLLVVLMLLLGAIVMVGCVDSNETTESSPSPEANITPSTTTAEQVYYFQTADNFVELDSQMMGPSDIFRHDEEAFGKEGPPNVKVTADIPSSVEINGVTYEIDPASKEVCGRTVEVGLKGVVSGVDSLKPFVRFDAINGNMTGFSGFKIRNLTAEEKKTDPIELAKTIISDYLPNISLEGYKVTKNEIENMNYEGAFLDGVAFRKYIGDYAAEEIVYVTFHEGALYGAYSHRMYSTENLGSTLIDKIDKKENEKIILSLIDYVKNGHTIKEPELWMKSIVWMPDGRYAIRYDIIIKLDDPDLPSYSDRISACIYLDDSKAE